jgi:serine/threonine-protein kinase RsbW
MKMTILERDDDITHIVLDGHFDSTATEEIREEFAEATVGLGRSTIVDLSCVEFLASRGIGILFINGKLLKKAGQQMVLLKPQDLVGSVLKTSKVDHLMPILHDFDEAVRLLGGVVSAGPGATEELGTSAESVKTTESLTTSEKVEVTIKNELAELPALNETLNAFMAAHDVPKRAAYAIRLAIDELVVNVICYAFVDDDLHTIEIDLGIEGDQIILRIEDDGRPFDPRTGPTLDLHAEDRGPGGLGLLLVLDMVDVLKYRRVNERNLVEIRVHQFAENEDVENSTGEQSDVESAS